MTIVDRTVINNLGDVEAVCFTDGTTTVRGFVSVRYDDCGAPLPVGSDPAGNTVFLDGALLVLDPTVWGVTDCAPQGRVWQDRALEGTGASSTVIAAASTVRSYTVVVRAGQVTLTTAVGDTVTLYAGDSRSFEFDFTVGVVLPGDVTVTGVTGADWTLTWEQA